MEDISKTILKQLRDLQQEGFGPMPIMNFSEVRKKYPADKVNISIFVPFEQEDFKPLRILGKIDEYEYTFYNLSNTQVMRFISKKQFVKFLLSIDFIFDFCKSNIIDKYIDYTINHTISNSSEDAEVLKIITKPELTDDDINFLNDVIECGSDYIMPLVFYLMDKKSVTLRQVLKLDFYFEGCNTCCAYAKQEVIIRLGYDNIVKEINSPLNGLTDSDLNSFKLLEFVLSTYIPISEPIKLKMLTEINNVTLREELQSIFKNNIHLVNSVEKESFNELMEVFRFELNI
jgi:hypothetical protein